MRYIIIGGGVSGLTMARLLSLKNEVLVLESEPKAGGLIRCEEYSQGLFHTCGGHVFNTKSQEVRDWFWSIFDKRDFMETSRNSAVVMDEGTIVSYPIEDHIYMLERQVGSKILKDWLAMLSSETCESQNFADFLIQRFGKTLYELYFKPYNQKIWRCDLKDVPLSWLKGKLPMPSVEEMLLHNMYHIEERKFVHSHFYYSRRNGSQHIINTLLKGVKILYNIEAETIERTSGGWIVNGIPCERIIFCGNIKQLPSLIDIPEGYADAIDCLGYHGTTSVFCEIDRNPYSWLYMPSLLHESHRIICTGNFSLNNNHSSRLTATIEFTDEISKDEILDNLKRIPLNPDYITHHYTACSYPIQDMNTRETVTTLKRILSKHGFYLCGRFAEWEYANTDVCMGSAIKLYKKLL